ncbi:MAG: hypothetical protein GYB66_01880 [Chloroflexi bacterium]|nr:hypothetical protein [Chloroflexota bacterium]
MSAQEPIPRHQRIQRIQLETYDDVVSVKDRLQFVEAGRVLLVFPTTGRILQRKLDLVLILREAARRDLRLALVVQDVAVVENARELNIACFYTVEEARTQRWTRPRAKVFVDRQDRPQSTHDPYELMMAATRLKPPLSRAQQSWLRVFRGGVFGVAILALLFGLFVTVPSARVTLSPARDELNVTINIVADPSLETARPESLRITASRMRIPSEATVTIETSGKRPAENSLAEGIVTFTNNTELAHFIPVGTIVQTASVPPVQFQTTEEAALPARQGATVKVAIRALDSNPGLSGNQPAGAIERIEGDLSDSITVTNQNATYGAGLREIAFVTAFDHERLLTLARQQVRQNARDLLLIDLDESTSLIVPETINVINEREVIYSAQVDQPAESVTLTLKATVEATIIDLTEARLAAFTNLGRYMTGEREFDDRNLTYRTGEIQQILEDGSVVFQMRIEGTTYVNIDANQVRERLAGLSEREARNTLEREYLLDPRHSPEVETWPGFLNRMPVLPMRIEVDIRQNG